MARKIEISPDRSYIRKVVPWGICLGIFVLYLFTLNHWISFGNLLQVSKLSGYAWQPELQGPLTWLVTLPLRLLPAKFVPMAVNIFAAVCAALTCALLARSIALWPHDRTHDQRQKELGPFSLLSIPTAWLAPVLGVLVCALQLTFWENATSANSISPPFGAGCEMLDLLAFAYVIRCLLEFRLDQRESWLIRSAFVYGLAMTSNWAMIAFFPLFLIALFWVQGLNFFNVRFLVRLFLAGLAGLSLYLLLPLAYGWGDIPVPFWPALKLNLGAQKQAISSIYHFFMSGGEGKQEALLLALTSFIPLLLISIKWASYFGDTSKLGVALTTFVMHFVHGLFLVACLWVALDPPFSPRSKGFGLPFLTLTYLSALSVGYLAGYFLLIFRPEPATQRRTQEFRHVANLVITALVWAVALLTPTLLLYKNLPQIRMTNGPTLKKYASFLAANLPAQNGIILSDDLRRSVLAQALRPHSEANANLFIDTTSLPAPEYHRYLKKHFPSRWPLEPGKEMKQLLDPLTIRGLLMALAETNQLYYLHPSFGYYFEAFYQEAHGPVYRLLRYPTNTLTAPLPNADLEIQNQKLWAKAEEDILPPVESAVKQGSSGSSSGLFPKILQLARVTPDQNRELRGLGTLLSRPLDLWGVEEQRLGNLPEAAGYFQSAQDVNPENIVAKINLECNKNLQAGRKATVRFERPVEEEFGKFRSWDQIMNEDGPFDEPTFCFKQGLILAGQSLYRQAATEFGRAHELDPENLYARLWLAQLYVLGQMPDQALKVIDELHANPTLSVPRTNANELLYVELSAHLVKNDVPGAENTVAKLLDKYPNDLELITSAAQIYINFANFSNALPLIERQLKVTPDNLDALLNKGVASLQLGAFDPAIEALTKVLSIETNSSSELYTKALLSRAIAYLRSDQLDEAQRDYEALQRNFPLAYRVYYGLGDIAYRRKDTNAAIRNYQLYLTNSPANPDEIKTVTNRLRELQAPPP